MSMYRKPVCVHCNREFRTAKAGIIVVDVASYGPHRYVFADLLECPGCRHQVTWGYGDHPMYRSDAGFVGTLIDYKHMGMRVDCTG